MAAIARRVVTENVKAVPDLGVQLYLLSINAPLKGEWFYEPLRTAP